VKITIDTKEDSPDELRKIIRLLNELINQKEPPKVGIFDTPSEPSQPPSPEVSSGLMSMFDQSSEPQPPESKPEEKPPERHSIELY